MEYSFDIDHAAQYGVEEAIMLKNFIHWIRYNKANGLNEHDGRTWTYNSKVALAKLFPFWSEAQIKRILQSLRDQGVLIIGNYNKIAYDRTLWYAFASEESFLSIGENEPIERNEQSSQTDYNHQPIPDIKPYDKPDVNPDKESALEKPSIDPAIQRLTQMLYDQLCINCKPAMWDKVPPKLATWYPHIEKMSRIDKMSIEEIERVIMWVARDNFWQRNIRSGEKLRAQNLKHDFLGQSKSPRRNGYQRPGIGFNPDDPEQKAALERLRNI